MRHRFHALCPYFAMFPESFAERWIDELTKRGDVVLDPFSGRGTTALSALLMDRRAIATDVNDVAYCLTRAKTNAPSLSSLMRRITMLEGRFDGRQWLHSARRLPEFFRLAYAPRTLQHLVYLRERLRWRTSSTDSMIAGLVLGSLHGEMDKSSSYLSNQMPRTISTKPAYSIRFWLKRGLRPPDRDTFAVIRARAEYRYESPIPKGDAVVLQRDMRELPWLLGDLPKPIRCVITSPPYLNVTNFEEDQWLRIWFLGGPPMPTPRRLSRDDRHVTRDGYWRFIADMWRSLGRVVARRGHVVIRMGCRRTDPSDLIRMLTASTHFSARKVERISVNVSPLINKQTSRFRSRTVGVAAEVDCHFRFRG